MATIDLVRRITAALALVSAVACHHSGHSSSSNQSWSVATARPDGFGAALTGELPFGPLGSDYVFERGATLVELADGRAHLRGLLRSSGTPENGWQVSLDLARRLAPTDARYEQQAEPREELDSGAYVANGGVIDPRTWSFFELAGGELFGIDAFAGARAALASPTRWCLQRGAGASNLALELGAEADVLITVVSQPLAGAPLPTTPFEAFLRFALHTSAQHVAHDPEVDPLVASSAHGALEIGGIGTFAIAAGGELVERLDGTAHLEAQLVDALDATRRFEIALDLTQRLDPSTGTPAPAGSPLRELEDGAYRENGGPIDVGAWRYYVRTWGELRGLETLAGARIAVSNGPVRVQVGYGAHGASLKLGASAVLALRTTRQPDAGAALPWDPASAPLRLELAREYVACALDAETDPLLSSGATFAIAAPDLANDLLFSAGGTFREHLDGTAEMRGIVASASAPLNRWQIELAFSARVAAGDPSYPPAGSPLLDLVPGAYVANGGTVDPAAWHFYDAIEGQLVGLSDNVGARVGVSRGTCAVQVGQGANGRNLHRGVLASLSLALLQNGVSIDFPSTLADGEMRVEIHRGCVQCPTAAQVDPDVSNVEGGFALALGGVAGDLVFKSGARFVERADGSARLAGTLIRAVDGSPRFEVALELRERLDPGAAAYPPSGSPRLQLLPIAYDINGGTVAPSTWSYFRAVEGVLAGVGPYEGARLALARTSSSAQLGLGASGRNTSYGASSTLIVHVVAQPASGPNLAPTGSAELAIVLAKTCD